MTITLQFPSLSSSLTDDGLDVLGISMHRTLDDMASPGGSFQAFPFCSRMLLECPCLLVVRWCCVRRYSPVAPSLLPTVRTPMASASFPFCGIVSTTQLQNSARRAA